MKKTLIAASIAALAATSANAAVKIYESETGSLSSYGKVQLELENRDGENTIQNQGSRLGFSGDTQLDNGMTAFTNFEFRFQPGVKNNVSTGGAAGSDWTVRNSYLGVKGDFGSIKAGNFDSITYTMVTSQADIMENAGYRSLDSGDVNAHGTAIAYETNDISGFKFGLGIKHYASNKSNYAGAGAPLDSASGDEEWNIQLGATYQLNDELSFGLAVDQNNEDGRAAGNGKDPIIAASAMYATDLFGAGVVVESNDDAMVANLTGSVNYGAGDVYALVSFVDDGNETGVDFGLGANYKLAKNFVTYGEVAVGNDKDALTLGDLSIVTLGAAYKW
ncbi:porin [Marinospirillum minutulum]|uniref:porin n=1 Tax=Marinospirillum minutulum TaxID=64974 RepID=UPI00040ACB14|nr:porin [Marinospirillum minutulum]